MTVRIHLLGQVCVEAGEAVLPASALPGRQGRLAFAYLALARHPIARDELADVLWADALPSSWTRDLSAVVSKLKAQFARVGMPDAVRSALGCYELVLPSDATVDVEAVRTHVEDAEAGIRAGDHAGAWGAASAALNLASRPFLPGESGEWVETLRNELIALAVRAADALATIEAARGNWTDAAAYADAAIGRAPYRESGYVTLIDVQLAAGNRAEALRTYERARALLAEELGVPPSAPLEAAYRRALCADAPPEPPAPASDGHALVGRARELAVLRDALRGATGGRGRLVLVAGEPGVGKTRLAEALVDDAADRGVVTFWGACWPGEGAPPLWAWTQVLRDAAAAGRVDDELLLHVTDGDSRTGLLGDVDPSAAKFRLLDRAVDGLRHATAAGPVLIVLDDLHWADRLSLDLLSFLARALRAMPVLVVGTYRDTEVEPAGPLAAALDEVGHDAERLTLAGLAHGDTVDLASAVAGMPVPVALEDTLHDYTAGNPFFVKEVARLLAARGAPAVPTSLPAAVREVLDRRLGRLSPGCRDALAFAALIGRAVDVSLVAEAAERPHDAIADAIDEACTARVVREVGAHRFAFTHELFRQAVLEGLPRGARSRMHLRVGFALEARFTDQPGPHMAQLAHHFVESAPVGDVDRAVGYAEQAGAQAARVLAFDEAAEWYGRALDVLGARGPIERRLRLLLALAEAAWRASHFDAARSTIAEAVDLARAIGDGAALASAALVVGGGLGGAQPLAEPDAALVALLEEALATLPPGDGVLRCRVLARLAAELYLTNDVARRDLLSAEAVEMARRTGDRSALATALYARQIALLGPDGLADREAAAEEVLALAADADDRELAFWGHLFRVWSRTERCLRVDDDLDACARLADELGVEWYRAEVTIRRAVVALVAGRPGEFDSQLARLGDTQTATTSASLTSVMVLAAWLRGPLDDIEPTVAELVASHPDRPLWRAALGALYAELGRGDDARAQLAALAESGATVPRDGLWLFAMQFLAFVCFVAGDDRRADDLHPLVLPYAEQAPIGAMGSAMVTLGLLDAARGDADAALEWLERGEARNRAHGNVAFALWARRERAAVLVARDGPDDRAVARVELEQLVAELRELGFHGFLVRAERLLAAATP